MTGPRFGYRFADVWFGSNIEFPELPRSDATANMRFAYVLDMVNAQETCMSEASSQSRAWTLGSDAASVRIQRSAAGYTLRFPGQGVFFVATDEHRLSTIIPHSVPQETVRHLFLDQVLPRLRAHAGRLILHAAATAVDGHVVAFIGSTGSGKSTLAASFGVARHDVLSDDGLLLTDSDGCPAALPTYRSLRLWPDALASVFPKMPNTAPMAHYSSKRRVSLIEDSPRAERALPLAAFYMLDSALAAAGITVSRLSGREACMALISNAFQLDPSNHVTAIRLLDAVANVASRVPAFSITYPRDFARLPEVRSAILAQRAQWTRCASVQATEPSKP